MAGHALGSNMDLTKGQREWWSSPGCILSQNTEPLRFMHVFWQNWMVPAVQGTGRVPYGRQTTYIGQIVRGFSSLRCPKGRVNSHTPSTLSAPGPTKTPMQALTFCPHLWFSLGRASSSHWPQQSLLMSLCCLSVVLVPCLNYIFMWTLFMLTTQNLLTQ